MYSQMFPEKGWSFDQIIEIVAPEKLNFWHQGVKNLMIMKWGKGLVK